MISTQDFIESIYQQKVGLFTGVPCSLLKSLINRVIFDERLQYLHAVSEGEAVGIAAGSSLTGNLGVVMLQNSGLGNIINPVTSLTNIYRIPCLIIVSHRGEVNGWKDAPQHRIMGNITKELLDLIGISWQDFPVTADNINNVVENAFEKMHKDKVPSAFVLQRGVLDDFEYKSIEENSSFKPGLVICNSDSPVITVDRHEAIAEISALLLEDDLVVSTTGKISRELYTLRDRSGNFYMQGSMGTSAAIGLGISINRRDRHVIILDGDGAILMRMGSLATIGNYQPSHYIHIVLDNSCYGSTGGQSTSSPVVSFPEAAVAMGYRRAVTVYSLESLSGYYDEFYNKQGPSLIHMKVRAGSMKDLGRPVWTPEEIRDRFIECARG